MSALPASATELERMMELGAFGDRDAQVHLYAEGEEEVLEALVRSGAMSVRTQLELVDMFPFDHGAIATHSSDPEVQEEVACVSAGQMHVALAENTQLSRTAAMVLTGSDELMARKALAINASVHPDALMRLVDDPHPHVSALAGVTITEHVIPVAPDTVATSSSYQVRMLLAMHRDISVGHAMELAADPVAVVRSRVVDNPAVTLDDRFPVQALRSSARGVEHLARETSHFDPDALTALAETFTGTLEVFKLVLEECSTPSPVSDEASLGHPAAHCTR